MATLDADASDDRWDAPEDESELMDTYEALDTQHNSNFHLRL